MTHCSLSLSLAVTVSGSLSLVLYVRSVRSWCCRAGDDAGVPTLLGWCLGGQAVAGKGAWVRVGVGGMWTEQQEEERAVSGDDTPILLPPSCTLIVHVYSAEKQHATPIIVVCCLSLYFCLYDDTRTVRMGKRVHFGVSIRWAQQ